MAEIHQVTKWANALIALHLAPEDWTIGFDNAKRRAGVCMYGPKRISLSRYHIASASDDDIHQTLLHEVAHAMAGPAAGHGQLWKDTAQRIGYIGTRTYPKSIADDVAPWVGTCPAGHAYYRHQRPKQAMACGKCSRGFNSKHTIAWLQREISATTRQAARVSGARPSPLE